MFAVLAVLSSLAATLPEAATHNERLEHNGIAYEVTYQPHVRTWEKTVGAISGARTSLQSCRATTEVGIERIVRLPDGTPALIQRLDHTRRLTGHHTGPCEQSRRALAAARAKQEPMIREHVRMVAMADRSVLLAQIDAAKALAVQ